MWPRRRPTEPTEWRDAVGPPRALIEHRDGAMAEAVGAVLAAEGYDVANCRGPDGPRRPCPLVNGGRCDRATEADVVFFGLDVWDEDDRAVLIDLKQRLGSAAIIVEIPESRIPFYADELAGCLTVARPVTRERLLDALARARG